MRHKKAAAFIIAVISVFVICSSAFAHSGRTDENGGHYDYSAGEYHYHKEAPKNIMPKTLTVPNPTNMKRE